GIEEQFYLLWPLGLLALLRAGIRRGMLVVITIAGAAFGILSRVALVHSDASLLHVHQGLDAHGGFGCLLPRPRTSDSCLQSHRAPFDGRQPGGRSIAAARVTSNQAWPVYLPPATSGHSAERNGHRCDTRHPKPWRAPRRCSRRRPATPASWRAGPTSSCKCAAMSSIRR